LTPQRGQGKAPPVDLRHALLAVVLGVSAAGCLRVPDDFPGEGDDAAGAPSTVAEVLERHVRAIGGEEKVRALTQRTVEARMVVHPEEGCKEDDEDCLTEEAKGSFFFQNTADGQMYRRNVVLGQVEERGFDGKLGWTLVGSALRIDTPDEAQLNREEAILHWYFDVAKRGVETTLLPPRREDSSGKVTVLDGVKWRADDSVAAKEVWFDRESGLRREEISREGEGENLSSQTIIYDDYREVDGVLVPYTIRVTNRLGERSQLIEFAVQKVSHDKIDRSKFSIPKVPKPEPVTDALLSQLGTARDAAKKAPRDASAQIDYARIAFTAAHFDEAAKACNATLAVDGREPEALVLLARIAVLQGRYGDALKAIRRAEKLKVRPELLARERGWIHHRRREFGQLAKELDSAGNPVLAGRYRAFAGKALASKITGDPCRVEVPLAVSKPLAIVDIEIEGKKTSAIVDTGAADVILTDKMAKEAGVSIVARSQIAEDLPEIGHGQVTAVKLGGLTLENVPINVFDDASIADMAGTEAKRVGAVIGVGTLADFAIAIDIPKSKLELVPATPKCKAQRTALASGPSVPFVVHETHYIYVLAKMNSAEGVYLVNTGMRGADLTANNLAYQHAGVATPALRTNTAPIAEIERFAIGDAISLPKLSAAWGYFQQNQTSDGFRLDGMVGLGALGKQRFVLDFGTQRLHFPKG
jgi:hypothetical protein